MDCIDLNNLDHYSKGASFLASGGGGDVNTLLPMIKKRIQTFGPVSLLSNVNDDDIILPVELVGAPVPKEKRYIFDEFLIRPVLELALRDLDKPITALLSVEVAGANALTPLCVAGELGLPLFDGDLLGRAFPDIYLISPNVFGFIPQKSYIGDPITGQTQILTSSSFEDLEKKARLYASTTKATNAALVTMVLRGKDVKEMALLKTVTKAIDIGYTLEKGFDVPGTTTWFKEKMVSFDYKIEGGFLKGTLYFENDFQIDIKNEYMVLRKGETVCIKAPNIITLLKDGNKPVLSDQIKVGDRVKCISMKGPTLWESGKGLELVKRSLSSIER